ncbi:MAG: hypothetical protein JJ975_12185 [Bacteroidia bacterium]|nr:hypothetical protein [Bacteroidia bacterium]
MKHALFFGLILVSNLSFGQTESNTFTLKLYSNFEHTPITRSVVAQDENNRVISMDGGRQFGRLTPGLMIQHGNSGFWEFEADVRSSKEQTEIIREDLKLGTSTTQAGADVKHVSTALRMEGGWYILPNSRSTFKPSIGVSATPGVYRTRTEPKNSQSFNSAVTTYDLSTAVVPRIQYQLNERLLLDLNFPFEVMTMSQTNTLVENPNFTARRQRSSVFDFSLFPNRYRVRLGLGVNI